MRFGRQLFDGTVNRLDAALFGRYRMRDEQAAVFLLRHAAVPFHARAGFELPGQSTAWRTTRRRLRRCRRGWYAVVTLRPFTHAVRTCSSVPAKADSIPGAKRGDGAHRIEIAITDRQALRQILGRGKAGRLQRRTPGGADSLNVVPGEHKLSPNKKERRRRTPIPLHLPVCSLGLGGCAARRAGGYDRGAAPITPAGT